MYGISRNLVSSQELAKYIEKVNFELTRIALLDHVPLGPAFKQLSFEDAANNLVLHRIKKKFEEPSVKGSHERADKSVEEFFQYDESLRDFELPNDPFVRKVLYEVRNQIHCSLAHYVFDSRFVEITNGESFVSSRGDTSIYAKLRDRKQWCVTPSCFDLFAGIAYRTHSLKRLAKNHFRAFCAEHGVSYAAYCKRAYTDFSSDKIKGSAIGFSIFRDMLKNIVTFVGGSRITTVPKNKETDRVILCEAMCNMITQRVIAGGIRECLKKTFGYDLTKGQELHNALIHLDSSATIDLKNASNSNVLSVVKWLLRDTKLLRHVTSARAEHVFYNDRVHHLKMVSPMGNGFTFELMTFILMHFARYFDTMASVFGDDIIVDRDVADAYTCVLESMQWKINVDKTFTTGPFKESCGGFVYEGHRLVSFDMEYSTDIVQAVINTNKLSLLAKNTYGTLRTILESAHQRILKAVPPALLGDEPKDMCLSFLKDNLPHLVWCPRKKRERLHKSNPALRESFARIFDKNAGLLQDLQYNRRDLYLAIEFSYSAIKYKHTPVRNVNLTWYSYYLYTGRVSTPTYRRTRVQLKLTLRTVDSLNLIKVI